VAVWLRSLSSPATHHLGIGFLVKKQIRGLIRVVSTDKVHEFMWLKLAGKGLTQDTYICNVYCLTQKHPVEKRKEMYAALLESCTQYMAKGEVLFVGDFNARLGRITRDKDTVNSNAKLLKTFLHSAFADGENSIYHSLLNASFGCGGLPTRAENGRTSIIDYLITAPESLYCVQDIAVECQDQSSGAIALGSDHHLLYVSWKLKVDTPQQDIARRRIHVYVKLQEPEILQAFRTALAGEMQDWAAKAAPFCNLLEAGGLTGNALAEGLDGTYTSLMEHISKAVSATIPSKVVGPDCRSWWDEELQELVNLRSEAYVALRTHCDNLGDSPTVRDETYDLLWNKYVQLRRQVHNLASKRENQQWQTLLSRLEVDFMNDRNHFFTEIVKIQRKRNSRSPSLSSLHDEGGAATSDPNKIKKLLFELHSGMGKDDPNCDRFNIPHYFEVKSSIAAISSTEKGPEFCEKEISLEEIDAALAEAQNHKACGLDQIANEPLKYGADELSPALHIFFNVLLKTGICSSIWAKALVHLIFKGRGADPISLTSFVSKVFKRIILNKLNIEAEEKGLLEEEQAGFRSGRSTRDQTYILRETFDSRKAAGLITFACMIDMTNAFPSTWQDGMWLRVQEL
jgi:hypothetical protein